MNYCYNLRYDEKKTTVEIKNVIDSYNKMMIFDMTLHDKTRVLFEHSNRQLRFRAMGQEVEKTHMACMVTSGMEHTICQIHSWVHKMAILQYWNLGKAMMWWTWSPGYKGSIKGSSFWLNWLTIMGILGTPPKATPPRKSRPYDQGLLTIGFP